MTPSDFNAIAAKYGLTSEELAGHITESMGEDETAWFGVWLRQHKHEGKEKKRQMGTVRPLVSQIRAGLKHEGGLQAWVEASETAAVLSRRKFVVGLWERWQATKQQANLRWNRRGY